MKLLGNGGNAWRSLWNWMEMEIPSSVHFADDDVLLWLYKHHIQLSPELPASRKGNVISHIKYLPDSLVAKVSKRYEPSTMEVLSIFRHGISIITKNPPWSKVFILTWWWENKLEDYRIHNFLRCEISVLTWSVVLTFKLSSVSSVTPA